VKLFDQPKEKKPMYYSRNGAVQGIFLAAALAMSCNAGADEIRIQSSTPYAESAHVRDAVKAECQLDTKLPDFIREYASANGTEVKLEQGALDTKKGKVLMLEITEVNAAGGGAWSGAKSMSVAGKLYDGGKQVGDFTAMRYSGGGFFGGYKGTCSIVGRCSKTLGKDIADWLKNPTEHAHLGN
jgi:hypothetical protein